MLCSRRNRNRTGKGKTCPFGCCESYGRKDKKKMRRYMRRVTKQKVTLI